VDVVDFGLGGGAFDGGELEGAELGEDINEAGEGVGADAGALAVGVPVVGLGDGSDLAGELLEVGVVGVGWLVMAVEEGDGVGDAGDEAVDGEAVAVDVDAVVAGVGEVFAEAVGLVEGEGELPGGDFQADVTEVADGGEAMVGDFVDVEGELGLHVLVFAFSVGDAVTVLAAKLGELDGDGEVGGFGVADGVADVVGEGADGEGELVGIAGVAKEVHHKITGPDVVGEVRVEDVAKGVVADVLDDAAAVGVGAGVFDLGGGEVGVAALEERDDGGVPGEVDELLVGEERVGVGGAVEGKAEEEGEGGESANKVHEGLEVPCGGMEKVAEVMPGKWAKLAGGG
jgi:hypothetical protein